MCIVCLFAVVHVLCMKGSCKVWAFHSYVVSCSASCRCSWNTIFLRFATLVVVNFLCVFWAKFADTVPHRDCLMLADGQYLASQL